MSSKQDEIKQDEVNVEEVNVEEVEAKAKAKELEDKAKGLVPTIKKALEVFAEGDRAFAVAFGMVLGEAEAKDKIDEVLTKANLSPLRNVPAINAVLSAKAAADNKVRVGEGEAAAIINRSAWEAYPDVIKASVPMSPVPFNWAEALIPYTTTVEIKPKDATAKASNGTSIASYIVEATKALGGTIAKGSDGRAHFVGTTPKEVVTKTKELALAGGYTTAAAGGVDKAIRNGMQLDKLARHFA